MEIDVRQYRLKAYSTRRLYGTFSEVNVGGLRSDDVSSELVLVSLLEGREYWPSPGLGAVRVELEDDNSRPPPLSCLRRHGFVSRCLPHNNTENQL